MHYKFIIGGMYSLFNTASMDWGNVSWMG